VHPNGEAVDEGNFHYHGNHQDDFSEGEWASAQVEVDPATPLLFVLSDELGLRGPKFGCGLALSESVTWDEKRVTSIDWRSYKSLYLGMELPVIDVALVTRVDVPTTGAGETAITLVAGSSGNAIFDASGVRVRESPFTGERVKKAMSVGR
jgi:hypothetical protein